MTGVGSIEEIVFPDTPIGRQAAWFIRNSDNQGADLTLDEIAEHMDFEGSWTPQDSMNRFKQGSPNSGIDKMEWVSATSCVFSWADRRNRVWRMELRVEDDPPHRINVVDSRISLDTVVFRESMPDDTAELAAVERESPMKLGDVNLTYDRGKDFLAVTRLMEENICFVAEEAGELLGVHCGAFHSVRVAGTEYKAMLVHHSRVPSKNQGRGIFNGLNMKVFDHYWTKYPSDLQMKQGSWAPYGYVALDNASAARLGGPGSWSFGPMRSLIDCASVAGDDYGRVATPDDAPHIVEILNACHDGEEMFLPYTLESLKSRLERAPDLYSWENLVLGDHSVLGVWASGLRVVHERNGESRQSVRASVLDHGFVEEADEEFEKLLGSYCAKLLAQGSTEVSFLTSEGSPNYSLLKRFAFQFDLFDFRMEIPEPEGAQERGLYVDPIYF